MSLNRTSVAAAMVTSAALAASATAQFVAPQGNRVGQVATTNLPTDRTQAYTAAPATVPGYQPPPPVYGGYGGYGYGPVVPDVMGGYLNGVANVTNANAQYQVTIQQARLAQSQADMSKLDLRRRIQQEKDYERSLMPNPETVRRDDIAASIDRARHDPPSTDIWSGQTFNDLLLAAQGLHRVGIYGPAVPLPQEALPHLHVTTGTARGSVGALNDGKPLQWPFTLRGAQFKSDRTAIDTLTAEVVEQAKSSSGIDADTLRTAERAVQRMNDTLRGAVSNLTPDEYTSSKRFLTQLTDSLKTLEQPNAGKYFTREWVAKGRFVPELIDEMTRQGLRFAPAVTGDEPYYTMIYQAMIAYDTALVRAAGTANLRAAAPPAPMPAQR